MEAITKPTGFFDRGNHMIVFNALRDFADGFTRGLSLFITERNDFTAQALAPQRPAPSGRRKG
jgi:hypothetical protein